MLAGDLGLVVRGRNAEPLLGGARPQGAGKTPLLLAHRTPGRKLHPTTGVGHVVARTRRGGAETDLWPKNLFSKLRPRIGLSSAPTRRPSAGGEGLLFGRRGQRGPTRFLGPWRERYDHDGPPEGPTELLHADGAVAHLAIPLFRQPFSEGRTQAHPDRQGPDDQTRNASLLERAGRRPLDLGGRGTWWPAPP